MAPPISSAELEGEVGVVVIRTEVVVVGGFNGCAARREPPPVAAPGLARRSEGLQVLAIQREVNQYAYSKKGRFYKP